MFTVFYAIALFCFSYSLSSFWIWSEFWKGLFEKHAQMSRSQWSKSPQYILMYSWIMLSQHAEKSGLPRCRQCCRASDLKRPRWLDDNVLSKYICRVRACLVAVTNVLSFWRPNIPLSRNNVQNWVLHLNMNKKDIWGTWQKNLRYESFVGLGEAATDDNSDFDDEMARLMALWPRVGVSLNSHNYK